MIQKKQPWAGAAVALAAWLAAPAAIASPDIVQANSQLRLGYVSNPQFASTQQYAHGKHVTALDGHQHGLELSASVQTPYNLYLSAQMSWLKGDNDYQGYGISGSYMVPIYSKDDYDFQSFDVAIKVGQSMPMGPYAQLTPYVTAGYSWWQRDDEKTGGYLSELSHGFYGLGAMWQYEIAPQWVLSVDGAYARNTNAQTEWVRDGAYFHHRSKNTSRWGMGVNYSAQRHLSLFAKWQVTRRAYGASQVDSNLNYEPAVHTKYQQLQLGLAYNF